MCGSHRYGVQTRNACIPYPHVISKSGRIQAIRVVEADAGWWDSICARTVGILLVFKSPRLQVETEITRQEEYFTLRTCNKEANCQFSRQEYSILAWYFQASICQRGAASRESFRHLRELVCECINHELESIGDAEFGIDRTEVMRNSGGTNEETFGDLLVLESFSDQDDHLSFSFSE